MTWLRICLSRIAALFRHRAADSRLSEEIQTHLDFLAADYQRRGLSPAEARLAARREFGGVLQVAELHREQRGIAVFDSLLQDLRYAARQLVVSPGFSSAAILTLALGIGANTAIFRVFDAVVLRPLPAPHPEQLVVVEAFRGSTRVGFTYPLFHEIAARQQVLAGMAAVADLPLESFELPNGDAAADVSARFVSAGYFPMLGVSPQSGRLIDGQDDLPGAAPAVVISDNFWRRTFYASPSAVGRSIRINGARFVVAGIAPPGFFGETVGRAPDVWAPLSSAAAVNAAAIVGRGAKLISVMGRLRPDVSPARAETALASLYDQLEKSFGMQVRGIEGPSRIAFTPGAQGLAGLRGDFAQPLRILMAIVAVVLLIACCNLANLLTARAATRTHEIAVRLSLGASRTRIFRQLLTESLLLALIGSGLGLLVAVWGSRQLIQLASPDEPLRIAFDFGWRILAFTASVAAVAVCLFGLAPAAAAARFDVASGLQASRRSSTSNRGRRLISRALVVAQISLSLLLISASALLVRSFWNLLHQDFGYRPEGVLLVNIPLNQPGMALSSSPGRIRALTERLESLPGVRSVAFDVAGPLSQWQMTLPVSAAGRPALSADEARHVAVSGGYFQTLGIPIVAGRAISGDDCRSAAPVAVLSETAARRLFGRDNPIGRMVSASSVFNAAGAIEVIGVARDVHSLNPRQPAGFLLYEPETRGPVTTIAIRTAGEPQLLTAAVRRILDHASGLRSAGIRPLWDAMRAKISRDRLMAVLSGAFGILSLMLAGVGIFGVIAYTVERRTREIGIRVALGATQAQISGPLMRDAGLLIAAGLAIGGAATVLAAQSLRTVLFGLAPRDPAMLSAAALILTAVALFAAFLPARRIARLDPTQSLRRE